MSTVNQDKLDKFNGYLSQDLHGALLVLLRFISDGLRLHRVFRWIRVEWLRYATIRNLNRLNDDCLDDIGIKRKDIRPIVKAMAKCIRKTPLGSQQYPTITLASMATAGVVPGWPAAPAHEVKRNAPETGRSAAAQCDSLGRRGMESRAALHISS